MKRMTDERIARTMAGNIATSSEVEGYGPASLPVGPLNLDGPQFIGRFPMSTTGSAAKVGRRTDSAILAKPDSERWWSTKPYVPPLH